MLNRRTFLKTTTAALGASVVPARAAAAAPALRTQSTSPSDLVRVAVMGVNSRGNQLARVFTTNAGCAVTVICDVDSRAAEKTAQTVTTAGGAAPRLVPDIRKVLEASDVDALVIAAPDHWHAPAAIMALQAGKHVYVEKPCSHNPREGELLVTAAARGNRIVQMGTQRRSWPHVREAIDAVRGGRIGRAYLARTWYANTRASIGHGQRMDPPAWLDYELWQGPAPRRPFVDNLVHYEWHWRWHWGTGESANNGTHMFDLARWGLGVEHPVRVTSAGGRYQYDDDWEFPDSQVTTFEYADRQMISWESISSNGWRQQGEGAAVTFHGDKGSLLVDGNGYIVFDPKMRVVDEVKDVEAGELTTVGPGDRLDAFHTVNFLEAVRGKGTPNAPIEEGHKSTLMAHLANIAWKTGRTLTCDPGTGHIKDDADAMKLWAREYEPGWEPAGS